MNDSGPTEHRCWMPGRWGMSGHVHLTQWQRRPSQMEKWAELSPAGTVIHNLQKHGRGQVHKEKCGGPLSANGLMCAIGSGCFTPTSTSGLTSGVCVAADVLTKTIHDREA